MNDSDFQNAIELIDKSGSILLTTHTKPDGDACGCLVVMREALTALGKQAVPLLLSWLPDWYDFLLSEKMPVLGADVQLDDLAEGRLGPFDLIVIVDTNSHSQLGKFDAYLKHADFPVLVIDHHHTSDGLGDVQIVDATAAATGLIVFDLLKFAGWRITERMAEALFIAIATDTGWFQFNNADSRAYRTCAELIELGAQPTVLYDRLFHNYSPSRFKLMVAMLGTLQLELDGRYASQHILQEHFAQTGATHADTENLINECHRVESVRVSALFVQLKDGRIRCSLRSRGPVDVSRIAAKFGGGGHKMAAGTYLPGPMESAKKMLFDEVATALAGQDCCPSESCQGPS